MITLVRDSLVFRFPEVHEDAVLHIGFQRTLRIPDDGKDYPLPPGLGRFPLRHVDDFAERVPPKWREHGGVMMPMYQSEALWLNFSGSYPFAIKVASGLINAVTGKPWEDDLHSSPQDYVVVPEQPWLDGFCVEEGVIRQFVAMPLGSGYTAEEQLTGEAEHGGLQLMVYPMKKEAYERYTSWLEEAVGINYCMKAPSAPSMGLAPGGRMRQQIYTDPHKLSDWDMEHYSRCFVHMANSLVWHEITGEWPPHPPPTAKEYTEAGLPWFDYYDDLKALKGSELLAGLKSVIEMAKEKGQVVVPDNESLTPKNVVDLSPEETKNRVREWDGKA